MIAQVAGHAKLSRAKISKENVRNNCRHKKLRKTQTFIEIGKAKKREKRKPGDFLNTKFTQLQIF